MSLLVTVGVPALLFALVIAVLQQTYRADLDFSDFTVAGRSFGGFAQAMAFFNTYQPGTVFVAFFAFTASNGVVGMNISTLLAPVVMFLMADRVWTWGATHDLKTQPDLLALRFDSRAVRVVSALVGSSGSTLGWCSACSRSAPCSTRCRSDISALPPPSSSASW